MKPIILFKYGGNAMINDKLKKNVLKNICSLKGKGYDVVIVHGGGPFIKQALEEARIETEFIEGHRKTTPEAFEYVEMALKGKVNGNLVSMINSMGYMAVGLSGKDGQTVIAEKRYHERRSAGKTETIDLGRVGDVKEVAPRLINLLLDHEFIPVITCLAADESGTGYNINGDMFAGHIAGALNASQYVVLTDVDGLLRDKDDPDSIISEVKMDKIDELSDKGIIQGGMIPKIESCRIAMQNGARAARIINGTKPENIAEITGKSRHGTLFVK
jgi:acetylglutamate kinase